MTQGGGEILYRDSLTGRGRPIDRLLLFLLNNTMFTKDQIDAFFVTSSSVTATARFIRRARELGLTIPILGPKYLFSSEIENYVGLDLMKDVTAVSLYDEKSDAKRAQKFVESFQRAYGTPPDLMAAVGYDAVKLLAHAVKKAGTRDATELADWLRIMRLEGGFVGATGPLVFDAHGQVTDTDVYIVRHDGTHFRTVASYKLPLEWKATGVTPRRHYRP